MRAWRIGTNPKVIEVWEVDDETGEMLKMSKLEFEQFISIDEARTWMRSHYPSLLGGRVGDGV